MSLNIYNALFPYEEIPYGAKVALYGAGLNGNTVYHAIQKNKYCNIVKVYDRNYSNCDFPIQVTSPEELDGHTFDFIVVTLSDIEMQKTVCNYIVSKGVSKSKIRYVKNLAVPINARSAEFQNEEDDEDEILKFAFILNAGLGDSIMALLPIETFRKEVPTAQIDLYIKSLPQAQYLEHIDFVDHVYNQIVSGYDKMDEKYDVVMTASWIPTAFSLSSVKINKVRRFSELLYNYFQDLMSIAAKVVKPTEPYTAGVLDFMRIKGLKKLDQWNPSGILPYSENSKISLYIPDNYQDVLIKYGLKDKKFIVICNTVDKAADRSVKRWPVEYYSKLCLLIKQKCPTLKIVRVGDDNSEEIRNTDMNLTEKTSLEELLVLLKISEFYIGSEGGLVHINHFLQGKSCCLFGPTDEKVYGYSENINVRSTEYPMCVNGCEGIYNYTICLQSCCLLNMPHEKELSYAKCMEALMPEYVYEKLTPFLVNL